MVEEDGNIVLKLDTHNNDLLKELDVLRKAKQLTDVTLAVGDSNIYAHRVVLSACSTYFRSILTRLQDCAHPVIVLKDSTPRQMRCLVDYMYRGEISVKQEDMAAVIHAADNLGIQLNLPNLPPLATSEPVKNDLVKSGEEVVNSSRSGREGRKGYRPKRIRTSPDSGNMSGSNLSSDANIPSPDSIQDRSYPSCPSRESNTSPIQNSANEHHHQQQQPTATQTEPIKNDQDRPKLQIAKNLLASPVDYSKSMASNSLSALAGLGMGSNHLPSSSLNGKDKKASMSILDSYLQFGSDKKASSNPLGLPNLSQSLATNPNHLAAAQNLAWLSQQGYSSSGQTSKGSEHESDKENHLTSHKASPMATSLPQVSMDIASRLQNAFWAANLNRDNPYGSWMNSGVNSGFAAVAAAAAAAMNSSAAIGTPATTSSSPTAHSQSPPDLPHPSILNRTESSSGMFDTSLQMDSFRDKSGGFRGLGKKKGRNLSNSSLMTPPMIGPNGKPIVQCDVCGKKLADPSSLYRHRKIHSGDKPHKCPYCQRLFIQRYNMTQHIKTHFKDRGINSLTANGLPLLPGPGEGEEQQQQFGGGREVGDDDQQNHCDQQFSDGHNEGERDQNGGEDDGGMSDRGQEDEEDGLEIADEEEIEPC